MLGGTVMVDEPLSQGRKGRRERTGVRKALGEDGEVEEDVGEEIWIEERCLGMRRSKQNELVNRLAGFDLAGRTKGSREEEKNEERSHCGQEDCTTRA
jgi:hypothetical protein